MGGEFVSEEFTDFCEKFNVKISTTPAESPWCNGICEQHNVILTELLLKVKEDIVHGKQPLHGQSILRILLLVLVVLARNQLVFGKNTSLPSYLNDNYLPGIQKTH